MDSNHLSKDIEILLPYVYKYKSNETSYTSSEFKKLKNLLQFSSSLNTIMPIILQSSLHIRKQKEIQIFPSNQMNPTHKSPHIQIQQFARKQKKHSINAKGHGVIKYWQTWNTGTVKGSRQMAQSSTSGSVRVKETGAPVITTVPELVPWPGSGSRCTTSCPGSSSTISTVSPSEESVLSHSPDELEPSSEDIPGWAAPPIRNPTAFLLRFLSSNAHTGKSSSHSSSENLNFAISLSYTNHSEWIEDWTRDFRANNWISSDLNRFSFFIYYNYKIILY